jgi:hypothetical protein
MSPCSVTVPQQHAAMSQTHTALHAYVLYVAMHNARRSPQCYAMRGAAQHIAATHCLRIHLSPSRTQTQGPTWMQLVSGLATADAVWIQA